MLVVCAKEMGLLEKVLWEKPQNEWKLGVPWVSEDYPRRRVWEGGQALALDCYMAWNETGEFAVQHQKENCDYLPYSQTIVVWQFLERKGLQIFEKNLIFIWILHNSWHMVNFCCLKFNTNKILPILYG